MKQFFFMFFLVASSFGAAVGDFAPMKSGSEWKYGYSYRYSYVGRPIQFDSIGITIKLQSTQSRGNDTLALLRVTEEGRLQYTPINPSSGPSVDSSYTATYVDTAVFSGDSIYKANGYRCRVFPFWQSHSYAAEGLGTVPYGGDTVYSLANAQGTYLQNVGLYYSVIEILTNHTSRTRINLVGYDKNPAATVAKRPHVYSAAPNLSHPGGSNQVLFMHGKATFPAFSIRGKRINVGDILLSGVVVIKASKPKSAEPGSK
jgi:hypothetical protein